MIFELLQSTIRSTIWLALGLGLAACSVNSNPIDEVVRPLESSSVSSNDNTSSAHTNFNARTFAARSRPRVPTSPTRSG